MKLEAGCSYAVHGGDYIGEIFIYVRKTPSTYAFLSIPKMENRYVESSMFELGLNENLLHFVEKIPPDVFSLVAAQFESNNNLIK